MDEDCYPTVLTMNTIRQPQHHNHINSTNSTQNSSSTNDSSSTSSSSDIDIDDSNVKDEPLSPGSSCPPSPNDSLTAATSSAVTTYGVNVNLANMAAFTNTDLVIEHKVSGFALRLRFNLKNKNAFKSILVKHNIFLLPN